MIDFKGSHFEKAIIGFIPTKGQNEQTGEKFHRNLGKSFDNRDFQ